MIKTCFIRGCRIVVMLGVLTLVLLVSVFSFSPDVNFFKSQVEQDVGKLLGTNQVKIEKVNMGWRSGPVIDLGLVNIISNSVSVQDVAVSLSYSVFQIFKADFAPKVILREGIVTVNLDDESDQEASFFNATIVSQNLEVQWIYQKSTQTLHHVNAEILPFGSHVLFKSDGLGFKASFANRLPQKVELKLQDTSVLPKEWQQYAQGLTDFQLSIKHRDKYKWDWKVETIGEPGLLAFDDVHVRVPFQSISGQGSVELSIAEHGIELITFDASELKWRDGKNYGDFTSSWKDGVLHIEALKGSTSTPMLWSWLWPIGDELFHQWLDSMQHGRITQVSANLDLAWGNPFQAAPTLQNVLDMKYHVVARAYDTDIALGLEGDYLYHVAGEVFIDENGLQVQVEHAVLNDDLAVFSGKYQIDWQSLLMVIDADGVGDVGRLHNWLDASSGRALNWGDAPATAKVHLKWGIDETSPQDVLVDLQPVSNQTWKLAPYDIPMQVSHGTAVWDFKRGLDLKHLQVSLPWLEGDFTAFLDKKKDWVLQDVVLDAYAPLAELTDAFILPVVNPQGITRLKLNYHNQTWSGHLDLTANDWDNFAGYDKEGAGESIVIPFSGKSLTKDILPMRIEQFKSNHHDFSFDVNILIQSDALDFQFKHVDTSAFKGSFDLLMPLDASLAWDLKVDAQYMDKPVLTKYLADTEGMDTFARPWTVTASLDKIEWEKSRADDVKLSFSSDKTSIGSVTATKLLSGDADLDNVSATFTLYGQDKYELHLFEAYGSGQRLQASGTVIMQKDGALRWQGLALMNGEFGALMEQAELDKLFREGEMNAVFIGHGEFKEGEPWWRKMKGGFKLGVDDGRILEGGTLTHLLAAISIVDLPKYLLFDRSDVVGEGLLYDKLQVEGAFESNKLRIDKLGFLSSALDAGGTGEVDLASGELDIILVARPWQNIEVFISNIPLLGPILTGEDKSLFRKVYHIHGPASDAEVDDVNPEDVGLPESGYLEDLFTPSRWFESKKKPDLKKE